MLCRAARISQATRPALQLQITTEPARIETWCYPLTAPLRRISPGWLRAACRRGNLDKHMLAQNSMQQGSVADRWVRRFATFFLRKPPISWGHCGSGCLAL